MANTYIHSMADQWGNPLLRFQAIGMNVTDSGSTVDSSLLNLQIDGSTKFIVYKSGSVVATSMNLSSTSTVANLTVNNVFRAFNSTISNISFSYDSANNTIGKYESNSNNNIKVSFTNSNTGNNSSVSLSLHDTLGITANNFLRVGILGNSYVQAGWTLSGESSGYVYAGNTNLVVGTAGTSNVIFFAGGTLAANERFRITSANQMIIANSTAIQANGSTGANNSVLSTNTTGVYWSRDLNINTLIISNTETTTVNSTSILLGNTGANSVLTTSSIKVQNSSSSVEIVNPANLYISNNTGFNLGTATKAANGSSYLPNGLLANWGYVSANTSNSQITFTTAYPSACYVVMLTPAVPEANNAYLVAAPSTAGANVKNSDTGTGSNVYYFALGV